MLQKINFSVESMLVKLMVLMVSGFTGISFAQSPLNTSNGWNMAPGVTELSHEIYDLHMIIFYVCVVIAVLVFGAMGYSMYKHRKSKGAIAGNFHENVKVELAWTIIPLIVLIIVAVPATEVVIKRENVNQADLNIKVEGSQWKWRYEYLDGVAKNIAFYSNLDKRSKDALQKSIETGVVPSYEHYLVNVDKRLIIPTGKRVRFLITAKDVIHSWWVPDFGVKQDAIPGFVNATWVEVPVGKEGIYRGECAELCGKDHAYMPVVVEAVTQEEYERWTHEFRNEAVNKAKAASKVWSPSELLSKGKDIYSNSCSACHQATGRGMPGIFPAIIDSPIATGPKADHISLVLNGKNAMPAFKDQLDDAELAAVLHYQRNGLNKVGDVTQPSDVKSIR